MTTIFGRTIDNQYLIQDLSVERLTLDPFNDPNDIGKDAVIGTDGYLTKSYPAGSNVITIKMDANDNSPYESTTLYGAVEKARYAFGTPTVNNTIVINVLAGSYYETQPIVLTPDDYYFSITGQLQYLICQFYYTGTFTDTWITVNCEGLEISDVSFDGQSLCNHVLKIDTAAGAGAAIDTFRIYTQHGLISQLYLLGGAICYSFFSVMVPNQDSTYAILIDQGSSLFEHFNSVFLNEYTDSACIFHYVDNGSFCGIVQDTVFGVSNITYGGVLESTYIVANNGSYIELLSGNIYDFNYIFKIFNGSIMTTRNIQVKSTQYVNNAYDSTCLWSSSGDSFDAKKVQLDNLNTSNTSVFYNDNSLDDDIGFHMLSNLCIGDKNYGSNCFIGNGGSNIQNGIVLTYDGATFTDISSNLNQANSVDTTLFTSLTAGIFYLGGDVKFSSIVLNITGAMVIGTAVLTAEYWNGADWVNLNFMASQSAAPYTTYAQAGLLNVELQVFRGDIKLLQGSNWVSNTVNGFTRYWIRYRILSGIMTTSPTANYYKLLYNTSNFKPDGCITHSGLARTLKNIPFDWNLIIASGATAPADSDIWFSTILKLTRKNNRFVNGRSVNGCFLLPSDLDSSCALSFRISFFSTTTATNQSWTFTFTVGVVNTGDLGYTAAPGAVVLASQQTITFTLTANPANGMFETIQNIIFYLPTARSASSSGNTTQLILFTLSRTSAGATDPIINQAGLYFYSWRSTQIVVL